MSNDILQTVFNEIFLQEIDTTINIFLCGSSISNSNNIRSKLYDSLHDVRNVNIVFPEWLFSDLLDHQDYDLLSLEKELANNVDIIILPLEGFGTIAELGVFAAFPNIKEKVIAINLAKYKRKRSFINLGPIKLIKRANQNNVIYYKESEQDSMIDTVVKRVKYIKKREQKDNVENLFNLSRFMLFLIGAFQPISKDELAGMIMNWNPNIQDYYMDPCINILVKNNRICSENRNYITYFKLSEEGHEYVFDNVLKYVGKIKYFSNLRTGILFNKLRKAKSFDSLKEGEKLLEN